MSKTKSGKPSGPTPPTNDEWRQLFLAAEKFRAAKCWEWMTDSDVWGVQNPETGEIGYCCVMGNGGYLFGLNLYKGAQGLEVHEMIQEGEIEDGDLSLLFLQKAVQLTYSEKADLVHEDLEAIKKGGLKVKGKDWWPSFRTYEPGLAPWTISGEEARWMTIALQQAPDILRRVKEDERALDPPDDEPELYLVLLPKIENGKIVWMETWRDPGVYDPPTPEPVALDIERLRALRERDAERKGIWEFEYSLVPMPIGDKGRPYYPYMAMWIDQPNDFMLASQPLDPEGHRQGLVDLFCRVLEEAANPPREIQVASDDAFDAIAEAAAAVGIPVRVVEELQSMRVAQSSLSEFFKRPAEEIDEEIRKIEEEGLGPEKP